MNEKMNVNQAKLEQKHSPIHMTPESSCGQMNSIYRITKKELEELQSRTTNRVDLWLQCEILLQEKSVKFRTLPEAMISQALSRRLRSGALVFPGSKSPLNHVLFLSPLDDHRVMIAAYSKNLVFPASQLGDLAMTAVKLNEASSIGLWKVESRNEYCFPMLEAVVGPVVFGNAHNRSSSVKEFLWKCCGAVDVEFNASGSTFTEINLMEITVIVLRMREFLEKTGFKKIKESPIARGVSFLVVLNNDDEDETSPWKRFPMKIDVTDLITFSVYFSLYNSVVNATKGFISTSKLLLPILNSQFLLGFYNHSRSTKQLQYTLKLSYQTLSSADLRACFRTYYDSAIFYYKWTIGAIVSIHKKTTEGESISDVWSAIEFLGDELQGDITCKKVEITGSVEKYVSRLRKIEASPELADYLLPHPFYRISESGQVLVKTSRSLLSLRSFLDRFETRRDECCWLLYELILKMCSIGVFPTSEMLFCTSNYPFKMMIIPGEGLHEDENRCFAEIQDFVVNRSLSLDEVHSKLSSGLLFIKPESFENSMPMALDQYKVIKNSLASEEYILYRINEDARLLRFQLTLLLYLSKLNELPKYFNKVIGFTEISDDNMLETHSTKSSFFLCEKYCLQSYGYGDPFTSMLSFLDEVEKLHSTNLYHWFICPLTLRQESRKPVFEGRKQLVLPCLGYYFAEFVYSCLKKACKDYLAPEVKQFLDTGRAVANPFAADVYSFCKCVMIKARITNPSELQGVEETHAYSTLERGLTSNPEGRPNLQEVRQAIEVLCRSLEKRK